MWLKAPGGLARETPMLRTAATLLVMFAVVAAGVAISRYADADDAPGGMVFGWALITVAVVVGLRSLMPPRNRTRNRVENDGT
jgi:hypothetical protein